MLIMCHLCNLRMTRLRSRGFFVFFVPGNNMNNIKVRMYNFKKRAARTAKQTSRAPQLWNIQPEGPRLADSMTISSLFSLKTYFHNRVLLFLANRLFAEIPHLFHFCTSLPSFVFFCLLSPSLVEPFLVIMYIPFYFILSNAHSAL